MSLALTSEDDIDNAVEENFYELKTDSWKDKLKRWQVMLFNFKIFKVTILHWSLLITWGTLLFHFTYIYRKLYQRTNLIATMLTNILLFGCSDILAQSISCFYSSSSSSSSLSPSFSFFNPSIILTGFNSNGSIFSNQLNNDDLGYESDNNLIYNQYGITPANSDDEGDYQYNLDQSSNYINNYDCDSNNLIIFNFWRWGCFMFWGGFIANFQVPWYKILNFLFTSDPSMIQVLERVLSDQLVYSPMFLFFFFTYSNFIMEGGNKETLWIKINKVYISTLGYNLMVWPFAQIINFSIIPKHYQVPFSSSVGVLWNCFLSMKNASNSI